MKKLILITLFAMSLFSCSGKIENKKNNDQLQEQTNFADASVVNVYYFHGKQRCKTCIAIENVTTSTVAENYKDNSKVKYVEINIDENKNKDLIEKYGIAFSSLIIAKGENYTDLTEQAFANAVNSPDILISLIKDEVNKHID